MRRLRDRLNNKKGFTLVELIVVIVIILILAAVLVPNVMRYIGQARESAFQSEAAGYLTELQGYEAEYYAKNNTDLTDSNWSGSGYALTNGIKPKFVSRTQGTAIVTGVSSSAGAEVTVSVEDGAVVAFGYADAQHHVSWEQEQGWTDVDTATWPTSAPAGD